MSGIWRHRGMTFIGVLAITAVLVACQSPQPASIATTAPAKPAPAQATAAPAAAAQPTAVPSAPATPVPATAAPAKAPEALKVGISAALTGPSAAVGMNFDRFIRLSLDDINAKGGVRVGDKVYRFDPVVVDDQGTSEGGRRAADRLVLADKVKFVLGTITSPSSGAEAVTEPAKVLLLAAAATDKALGSEYPLTLQAGMAHNVMRSAAIYEWLAKEHPQVKRVASIMTDDATGRAISDIAEANAKTRGITMLAKEFYPMDAKDFNPLVTRVLRQNPDGLDIGAAGARGPLFLALIKAIMDQGYKGPVYGVSGDTGAMREGASFIKSFTASTMVDYKADVLGAMEKEVFNKYIQKYGEKEVEAYTICGYNIPLVLGQAIEKAGTIDDAVKIAKVLREGEWDTLSSKDWGKSRFVGAKTFGLSATLEQPIYMSKVEGGKISTFAAYKGTMP